MTHLTMPCLRELLQNHLAVHVELLFGPCFVRMLLISLLQQFTVQNCENLMSAKSIFFVSLVSGRFLIRMNCRTIRIWARLFGSNHLISHFIPDIGADFLTHKNVLSIRL